MMDNTGADEQYCEENGFGFDTEAWVRSLTAASDARELQTALDWALGRIDAMRKRRIEDAAATIREVQDYVHTTWSHAAEPAMRALDEAHRLRVENHELRQRLSAWEANVRRVAKSEYGVSYDEIKAWLAKRPAERVRDKDKLRVIGWLRKLVEILEAKS